MPVPVIAAVITGVSAIYAAHEASKGNTNAAKTTAESSDKAAQIQAETADKSLAQAKEIYQQQRADEGPYRQSGYGALNALNFGLGLPPQAYEPPPSASSSSLIPDSWPTIQTKPADAASMATDRTHLANRPVTQPTGQSSVLVPVRNPQTGLVHLIPNNQVSDAIAAGGQVTR